MQGRGETRNSIFRVTRYQLAKRARRVSSYLRILVPPVMYLPVRTRAKQRQECQRKRCSGPDLQFLNFLHSITPVAESRQK
jgi:hypothetical protein